MEVSPAFEKVLADVGKGDMLELHKYVESSHLCPLKIVAIRLTLQIQLTFHYYISFLQRA